MDKHHVVIVGAGFGGIGLGARLRQAGITDFVIIERTGDLGGTWSRNTYPGAACDVPSALYSLSFAPNPHWSRTYATQPEILDYLRRVADDFGVTDHIRLDTELEEAEFDEHECRWDIATSRGDVLADVLVMAVGVFAEAAVPALPGLDSFRGTSFHTLHWDHEHSLAGERVAVIGTGASAVQVVPEAQKVAEHLLVFQRTPPWIVHRGDRPVSRLTRRLRAAVPALQRASRALRYAAIESFGLPGFVHTRFRHPFEMLGRHQLRRQVEDPDLRRRLSPDYMIGCKRAIFSDEYYPALTRDNVDLVTDPIAEITPDGIRTSDGVQHRVDTIVFATGFTPTPAAGDRIKGAAGRTVNDDYRQRPQSYLGAAYAGFPNLFTILGPFGAAGNQSALFMLEGQLDYIVDGIRTLRAAGARRFEVRPHVQEAFVDEMHSRAQRGTWLRGGCSSYYTNERGMNSGLYPNWSFEYRRRVRRFDLADYAVRGGDQPVTRGAGGPPMSRRFPLAPADDAFLATAAVRHVHTVDVARPPEEVWEMLTAADEIVSWARVITAVRWTSARPFGVGSTREVTLGGAVRLAERFYRWDEGSRMTFAVDSASVPGLRRFAEDLALRPIPGGTRLTWTFAVEPSPVLRPLLSATGFVTRRITGSIANGVARRAREKSEGTSEGAPR